MEAERYARQQAENLLIESQRQQAYQAELRREEQERQRQELEIRNEAARVLEAKLAEEREEARKREQRARQKEAEQLQRREEKKRIERERIEQERLREQEEFEKMQQAAPETLRDLRELIRNRYELDVKIWSMWHTRKPNRPYVQKDMDKADVIMEEILCLINAWGNTRDTARWSKEEWEKVEIIRTKIREGGYRTWANNPPWN